MKRNISKVLAIVLTLALVMSFAAVSASAVTYTETDGGETEFTKYLVVDSDSQIPDAEFEFTITSGTAVPGGADNALEIFAGPDADQIVIDSAVFHLGDTATAGTPDDETDTTKQYASVPVGIDLSGVTFTAPGVYRYVLTENATDPLTGFTYDTGVRYLDVFVFPSESDPTVLEVTTHSLRNAATSFERVLDQETGEYKYQYVTNPDVKTDSFTNSYEDVDLEFSKSITGNQADKNKKFDFTLELTDVNPGSYELEITGDNVVDANSTNVTVDSGVYTLTVGDSGSVTEVFHLTNSDVVKVLGLPVGYGYTLTEDAEEYESTDGIADTAYTDPTSGLDVDEDIATGFTNDRTGIIPTGVIIMIAPFAIGLLLFGAVILYMTSKRRRAAY